MWARGGIHPEGSGVDPQPRVAAPRLQGTALRYSSLAHGPCPDPRLQNVQMHFPQPETWSNGPGEVRLHRIEHGAIVMALGPDAVKSPTFPPPPAELALILEIGSIGAPQNDLSPLQGIPAPPLSRGMGLAGRLECRVTWCSEWETVQVLSRDLVQKLVLDHRQRFGKCGLRPVGDRGKVRQCCPSWYVPVTRGQGHPEHLQLVRG